MEKLRRNGFCLGLGMLVVGLGLLLLCSGQWLGGQEGSATPPTVHVSLSPASFASDPGPELVAGAEKGFARGEHYLWVGILVEGGSSYRVYFDRADSENFHFLDRRGSAVTLGLCESGIEQPLARAELEPGLAAALRIARHGTQMAVFQGSRLVTSAFDDRLLGGTVGLRRLGGGDLPVLKTEKHEDIHFVDDFMRAEKEVSAWRKINCSPERGDFQIKSLRHQLLSANAFNYMGAGHGIVSVVGSSGWDNYRFEVSMRGLKGEKIGLVIAFQDEKNYGLFRWTARPLNADGSTAGPGLRELVRVQEGREEILAQAPGGYLPGQWYRTETLVTYARVRIAVDGHAFFEYTDPRLAAGAAGLWCDVALPKLAAADPKSQNFSVNSLNELMKQNAVFDDVKIESLESIEDDFREPGALAHGWLVGGGAWCVAAAEGGLAGVLSAQPGAEGSKSLIGDRGWAQYRVACDVEPGPAWAGLVFLYRDEWNHYLARTEGRRLELVKVEDGRQTVLDRAVLAPAQPGTRQDSYLRLSVSVKHGHIQASVVGRGAVEGFEEGANLRGRAGLLADGEGRGPAPARFRRFRLAFLREAEPLVTSNAIFEDENSMRDWTSPTSEWYPPHPDKELIVEDQKLNLLWHRSQFPGDVELVVEPRQIENESHEVALSCAKDGKGSNNGYVFRYQAGRKGVSLALLRQGVPVKERALAAGEVRELSSLALRRAGRYLCGKINGKPALLWRDETPLSGSRVAYYSRGLQIRTESAKILSEQFHDELFSSAPADWRTAGYAIAEVTNRWQCDPRWSFFSLKNDRGAGKPAVLWSKHLYPGDVTVEFFVGNKMEQERGRPYTYARDINLTICSDGQDLSKGYTFMFGGLGNRGSYIYRNGLEVQHRPITIPVDMNYHRHWFYVRVEKRGNRLSYRVDRYFMSEPQGEWVMEDPYPVQGNRIALWTCDHALMISRIRISGDGGRLLEHPDQEILPLKIIPDKQE